MRGKAMDKKEIFSLNPKGLRAKYGDRAKAELTRMIRDWHPDVCSDPDAGEVIRHLNAVRKSFSTKPRVTALRPFTAVGGKSFGMRVLSETRDDLTQILVARNSVSRMFEAGDADLAKICAENIASFRFADDEMRAQMSKSLPPPPKRTDLEDGRVMLTFPRDPEEVLLSDLIRKEGPFDARTGAWIVSGLMNICCWLAWAGRAHGGIRAESVLVAPKTHKVRLFGGWEFSGDLGEVPIALPDATLRMFPTISTTGLKKGVDAALVREVAFRIFGHSSVSTLMGGGVPEPIATWATFPADPDPVTDYGNWKAALRAAFGEPKFVKMGVDPVTFYDQDAA